MERLGLVDENYGINRDEISGKNAGIRVTLCTLFYFVAITMSFVFGTMSMVSDTYCSIMLSVYILNIIPLFLLVIAPITVITIIGSWKVLVQLCS